MKEGSIILTPIPQADGKVKYRPALILREFPSPYRDVLVCGISTQIHVCIENFDEIIATTDDDFVKSGLLNQSLIRLGFLAVIPLRNIAGAIGEISPDRHKRLLIKLSKYLLKSIE